MTVTNSSTSTLLLLGSLAIFAMGCGPGTTATGAVQIFVEAEDTIPNGLSAGMGAENILDGWNVKYNKFIIAIGNFRAARSDAPDKLEGPGVYVLDLKNVPAGGYIVHTWSDIEATRWDRFGFDLPNATNEAKALEPTTAADKARVFPARWRRHRVHGAHLVPDRGSWWRNRNQDTQGQGPTSRPCGHAIGKRSASQRQGNSAACRRWSRGSARRDWYRSALEDHVRATLPNKVQ